MKTKQNNSIHLTLVVVLSIAFLAIMVLSTTLQNKTVEYNYIDIASTKGYEQIKLGTVELKNNGFMPAKVHLKNLAACTFEEGEFGFNSVWVSYSKADSNYYDGFRRSSIELGSHETQSLSIVMSSIPKRFDDNDEETSKIVYIFDAGTEDTYNFCSDAIAEDALHIVEVNILSDELNK